MVTMPKQLYDDVLKLKSPLAFKIVLSLLKDTTMQEGLLCVLFKKTQKSLRIVAETLQDKNIITILQPKDTCISDEEPVYVLHKRYFDIEDTCKECKFLESKVVGTYYKFECTKRGLTCLNKPNLDAYNISRFLNKSYEKCGKVQIYDKKINQRKDIHIDKWKNNDFMYFYIDTFKEYYPKLIAPENYEVISVMKVLLKKFREHSDTNWRRLLKRYITETLRFYSQNFKVVNIFDLNNNTSIQSFFLGEGKKIEMTEMCSYWGIYCSFFGDTKCYLERGEMDCTDSIRMKMNKKYN